jgi:hypothetical protein
VAVVVAAAEKLIVMQMVVLAVGVVLTLPKLFLHLIYHQLYL